MRTFYRKDIQLIGNAFVVKPFNVIHYGIKSDRDIYIGFNCIVEHGLICKRNVFLAKGAVIKGDVMSRGNVFVGSKVKIYGDVMAVGNILVYNNAIVEGDLLSDASITVCDKVGVKNIEASGDVKLFGDVRSMSIKAGGRTTVGSFGK